MLKLRPFADAAVAVGLCFAGATAGAVEAPMFEAASCGFWVPAHERATCGYVTVPERHDQPAARQIKLFTAVLHAIGEEPQPDPVIYLTGGPGETAFAEDSAADWWWFSEPYRQQRDFIVFDQRGVGGSLPSLNCPELDTVAVQAVRAPVGLAQLRAAEIEATIACRNRLRTAGVDLAAYSTSESASDVVTLAETMGAERFNLMAISYGTRVALTVMRRHAQSVRLAVLDSPYPPGVFDLVERPRLTARVFRQLFQDCGDDLLCAAAFPDLESSFLRTVAELEADPIPLVAPVGSAHMTMIDGQRLVDGLAAAFLDLNSIRVLPAMVASAGEGSLTPLRRWSTVPTFGSETLSEGMRLSVECRENVPFSDLVVLAKRQRDYAPYGGSVGMEPEWTLCDHWDVDPEDPSFHEPVMAGVPTLLITGTYDPITPPEWAYRQADAMRNADVLEIVHASHGVVADMPCAEVAIAAFLEDPRRDVSIHCPRRLARPQFYTQP